jgi:hypothetical protein
MEERTEGLALAQAFDGDDVAWRLINPAMISVASSPAPARNKAQYACRRAELTNASGNPGGGGGRNGGRAGGSRSGCSSEFPLFI